ncbi:NADH:flavin oxidoreductase [Streptomyces sp. Inha503]|uniref:NADH:flavin oxidoreductase n=1 Tax=Streptomyces sp. Inha503 TaxID=3383314 RepID=UPI0039A22EFB
MSSTGHATRINQLLGSPFTVGDLELRNRIVMAPMTRMASPNGVPGRDIAEYYARRAANEVGLIITEGVRFSPDGAREDDGVPHFYGAEALAGWAHAVRRVHEEGGRIIPQLWHPGTGRTDAEPPADGSSLAPSGHAPDGSPLGRAMTQQDIDAVIADYATAASDAERIGFDGVELNGAHGYLIDTFLWDRTNRRVDAYGGTPASRARFAAEVVAAVRAAVSPGFPIFLRLSQWKLGHYQAKLAENPAELDQLLAPIAAAGVDGFHASTRRYWVPEFDGSDLNLAGWLKKLTGKAVVTVGSVGLDQEFLTEGAVGELAGKASIDPLLDRLERDEFDLVAVGRALLSNPDWATKALRDRLAETVPFDRSVLEVLT